MTAASKRSRRPIGEILETLDLTPQADVEGWPLRQHPAGLLVTVGDLDANGLYADDNLEAVILSEGQLSDEDKERMTALALPGLALDSVFDEQARSPGNHVVIGGRRMGQAEWEGVFVLKRYVEDGQDCDGDPSYNTNIKAVFVEPDARGVGLANHMMRAGAYLVGQDLQRIAGHLADHGRRPKMDMYVFGEILTEGGQAVSDGFVEATETLFLLWEYRGKAEFINSLGDFELRQSMDQRMSGS